MEKQLPKNIRQIGNVSDNPKVYVEDYVDTFFTQMCEKEEGPIGAFLIGETFRKDDKDYIFIHGAVRMEDLTMKDNQVVLGDRTWKKACEEGKRYFAGNTILGWILVGPDLQLQITPSLLKIHEKLFAKKSRVFVMKDAKEKEEVFFVYKYNDLMQIGGHYIYYEKNPDMQEYMIATRKLNCVTPSETYEDRVTKDFRSAINKKEQEQVEKKPNSHFKIACGMVLLFALVMGVVSVNNYDGLQGVQAVMGNTFAYFSGSKDETIDLEDENEDNTLLSAGTDSNQGVQQSGNASSATDLDQDGDESVNGEADGSADTEADGSADTEADQEADGSADTEVNGEADGSADTEAGQEADIAGNDNTAGDVDGSVDTEADEKADTEADTEVDEDVDKNTDSETGENTDVVENEDGEGNGNTDTEEDVEVLYTTGQGDSGEIENLKQYVVQKGDTMVKICETIYGTTSYIEIICEINKIENSDYICVGQVLFLPE